MVLYGADRAQEYRNVFEGRVALLTGPSGRTSDNRPTIDVLKECCNLQLLLAPEHGVRGDKAAGALFEDEIDRESGLTVRSLYTKTSKRLSQETLSLFDTLVYDMADVGCRYYTFLTTLRYCIEDCAAAGKRLVVLDRPNPLGDRVEGGVLRQETESFVGGYTIPVCYGLTCGELAVMMNEELNCGCDLQVVPCGGLTRQMTFRDWGHCWVMPSVGIPRFETALLYPGTLPDRRHQSFGGQRHCRPLWHPGRSFYSGGRICPPLSCHEAARCGGNTGVLYPHRFQAPGGSVRRHPAAHYG